MSRTNPRSVVRWQIIQPKAPRAAVKFSKDWTSESPGLPILGRRSAQEDFSSAAVRSLDATFSLLCAQIRSRIHPTWPNRLQTARAGTMCFGERCFRRPS